MKDENLEKQQVLYVKMFGDFSVVYQGVSSIGKKKKETQFAQVLQLLLHNRQNGISRECLEKVLFGERMHRSLRSIAGKHMRQRTGKNRLSSGGMP